jgi:hypothetical protein
MGWSFSVSPLIPIWALAALGLAGLALTVWSLINKRRGVWFRAGAIALLIAALIDPRFQTEDREALTTVVAVVLDESASQGIGERRAETERLREAINERLQRLGTVEVRWITVRDTVTDEADGTELFRALSEGLGDVPAERIGGAIVVTDGQIHDIPADAAALGLRGPLHALITGRAGERDRRLILTNAPRFGIVGQSQRFSFRIEDVGVPPAQGPLSVAVSRDGERIEQLRVRSGENINVDIEVTHAGDNVIEIEVEPLAGELTTVNNHVAVTLKGVRENLRVLLVSGEPHNGERTWRNLLKSDASVNLIHFTILRPPHKVDGTPIRELSLIAFPVRELFQDKIAEFDLIIFDRYERRGILPSIYFDNIARYVRNGGALLIAAGPEDAGFDSLFQTSLSAILPAEPRGLVTETPFHARLTDQGQRHPVTRGLPGASFDPPRWSRWFRLIDMEARSGRTIMQGHENKPLLVLDRPGEGRVALLLSDHAWLWARGFEGGGPHADLLRRISHWLMKEPDLEEEALRVRRVGRELVIERQSMEETTTPADIAMPTGQVRRIDMQAAGAGLWRASIVANEPGIWRITQGERTVLIHVGPLNPREFADPRSSTELLAPIAQRTGGSVARAFPEGRMEVPRVVTVRGNEPATGPGWVGVRLTEASLLKGIESYSMFAGLLGLALLLAGIGMAWFRESR